MNDKLISTGKKSRLVLITLVVVCLLPLSSSWLMYWFTDIGKSGSGSHGNLLNPPTPLGDVALLDPVVGDSNHRLYGKWSLLYLVKTECDIECKNNLNIMYGLWVALGADTPRLQRILGVVDIDGLGVVRNFIQDYQGQLVLMMDKSDPANIFHPLEAEEGDLPFTVGGLYLIDPLGNLMMFYPSDTNPNGILKDLKRLLKYSRIG